MDRPLQSPALPFSALLLALTGATPEPAHAQERWRDAAVVSPNVACREAPSSSAEVAAFLRLMGAGGGSIGEGVERTETDAAGETWAYVGLITTQWAGLDEGCWVHESALVPTDGYGLAEDHLLRIADAVLAAPEGRPLADVVAAYNVFADRRQVDLVEGSPVLVAASALLGLRRLELLEVWLQTFSFFSVDPLTLAVVRSLDAEVQYFEPAGDWILRDDAWATLHERHRGSPAAHEILWKHANLRVSHDCEGDVACYASATVANRVGRYWVAYPDGPHVAEAVARASERLRPVLQGCTAAQDAPPGSLEARLWETSEWTPRGAAVARELRASLRDVSPEDRAPMIELLDALEACGGPPAR